MAASFKETVKQIAHAEKNVDKVLKAARLQRCERQRFSSDDIFLLIVFLSSLAAMMIPFTIMLLRG